jgi:hypothetical protein
MQDVFGILLVIGYVLILSKNGLATFWAIFSQAHHVTLR